MQSEDKIIDIYLNPGEYFVGDARYRIQTLLGSCVSIMLWHPTKRIGALSHFLLASHGKTLPAAPDARYGDDAMMLMLRDLNRLHVTPAECHGKIFGGGNMFPDYARKGVTNVGLLNGEAARRMLKSHGIRIVSENLFGDGHRKIIFDVKTGDVWIRQIDLDNINQSQLKESP